MAVFLDLSACNHGLKGPQKPKTDCDNSSLRSYLSLSVFTVRSGPVWRQDLAILSLEGPRDNTCQLREKQRGGNSGEGKTYHKSPPQKRFWTPPTYDTDFPPPLFTQCHFLLRGNGDRPDKSHFLRPPKLVLEGVLYGTFPPPPPNRTIRFAPPPSLANSQLYKPSLTWWTFRIFFIFFCSGRGKGESQPKEGGRFFLLKIPLRGGGGVSRSGGGAEGPGGCLGNFGGGGG